eukprot:6281710-Amphidinium_carterae.1
MLARTPACGPSTGSHVSFSAELSQRSSCREGPVSILRTHRQTSCRASSRLYATHSPPAVVLALNQQRTPRATDRQGSFSSRTTSSSSGGCGVEDVSSAWLPSLGSGLP